MLLGSPAAANDFPRNPSGPAFYLAAGEATQLLNDTIALPRYTLLAAILGPPRSVRLRTRRNLRLEITPLVDGLVDFIREAGVPVKPIRSSSAERPLGISASFKMGEDMPAISFYARDCSPELFGAFYPVRSGVTWAVMLPVQRFTLRLQGGNDSEFGYFAIAGVEWRHRARPLAAGIGFPINLRNAAGDIGVVFQLRMKLG